MRSPRVLLVVTVAVLAACAVAPVRADDVAVDRGAPECLPRTAPIAIGANVGSATAVAGHPRVTDLTIHSSAMQGDVHVDVLVPPAYDPSGRTRYPVLYLLHGALGKYSDYVDHGIDAMVGDRNVI